MRLDIDVGAPALAHGIGLFETMLVRRGRIVRPGDHFRRLDASARALGFAPPDVLAFRDETAAAFEDVAAFDEAALRCLYVATGAELSDPAAWRVIATAGPLPRVTLERREQGRAIALHGLARSLPQHKMTSYAASSLGLRRAIAAGANEGLFLDTEGRVLEGTATNIFAVAGNALITAPVDDGILPGLVRAWVLAYASRNGIAVEERAPSIDEIRAGSFMTGSLTTIAAVREIEGVACAAPGEVFEIVRRAYATDVDRETARRAK